MPHAALALQGCCDLPSLFTDLLTFLCHVPLLGFYLQPGIQKTLPGRAPACLPAGSAVGGLQEWGTCLAPGSPRVGWGRARQWSV